MSAAPDGALDGAPTGAPGGGVEREIKLPVADLGVVRSRLLDLGARLETPRALERNRVYDRVDGGDRLLASGRLLRLREDGSGCRLTYKGVARFEGGAKIREEHELVVGPAATVARILEGVGFVPVKRYEKWRETWRLGDHQVTLDQTPIGDFVEVEDVSPGSGGRRPSSDPPVESGDLAATAARLGLDPETADPRSYLALYEAWRSEHPEAPEDMVFEVTVFEDVVVENSAFENPDLPVEQRRFSGD